MIFSNKLAPNDKGYEFGILKIPTVLHVIIKII